MTTTTVSAEAQRRVLKGVAWLDATQPGWEERVELYDFDIASTCSCVIGQVFAGEASQLNGNQPFPRYSAWSVGMRKAVGADYTSEDACAFAVEYGFDLGDGVSFEELQVAWEQVLRERGA
jgi:glucose/arabinose dehydrogenase